MEIILNNWQSGISLSPEKGFTDMRNVNVSDIPDVVLLNLAAAKKSGTTITGIPKWIVRYSSNGDFYTLDSVGKLYKSSDGGVTWAQVTGNTTASASGNGLAIWKGYVFVARDSLLDTYSIAGAAWNGVGWPKAITTDTIGHPMLAGQDDILYGGAGRYVFSLSENAGMTFDPATAGTFTWNATALDLPAQYRIRCLAELGLNLEIGTFVGSTIGEQKIADIFPWDRSSSSFGIPVSIKEAGVNQMINVNNQLIIQAGTRGKYFKTLGTTADPLTEIPYFTRDGRSTSAQPGAITSHKGKVFSGISFGPGSSGGGTGVYSFNAADGSGLVLENTISAGTTHGNVIIGGLAQVTDTNYLIGWSDGIANTQGIDLVGVDDFATGYIGFVESPMYKLGQANIPATLSEVELLFLQALQANEGAKIYYRTDSTASYTLLFAVDYATYGAITKFNGDFGIDAEQVQFRLYLTGTTTTPRLKEFSCR